MINFTHLFVYGPLLLSVLENLEEIFLSTISNISSRFSINSEAFASELLENIEEIFPHYHMYSDMFIMLK